MYLLLSLFVACTSDVVDTDVEETDLPDMTTDVLVIGSGPAGLAAAEKASEGGLSVQVLEKAPTPGGSGWYAGRYFAVETRFQQAIGVSDSVEAAEADWPKLSNGGSVDEHVDQLIRRSSEVVEWIVDELHVNLLFVGNELGQDPVPRMHSIDTGNHGPVQALVDRLSDRILVERAGTELVIRDGRVVGCRYEDVTTGETGWIAAGATIVASGGFARNAAEVLRDRPEFEGVSYLVEIGFPADGGGVSLLEDAGAQWQNRGTTGFYAHSIADPDRPGETLWPQFLQNGMFIDIDGHRVVNEETMTGFLLVDTLLAAPEHRLLAVMPASEFLGTAVIVPPYNVSLGKPSAIPVTQLVERGVINVYDDPGQLAAAFGMDTATVEGTFARYQSLIDGGEDVDFHKDPEGMRSLDGQPLVVLELRPGAAKSYSGFAVDINGRITSASGAPIPGLYGAGEAIGALGSPGAGRGFSGSITAVYLTGIVAGETAVIDAAR